LNTDFIKITILDHLLQTPKPILTLLLPILLTCFNIGYFLKKRFLKKGPIYLLLSISMAYCLLLLSSIDALCTLVKINPSYVWMGYSLLIIMIACLIFLKEISEGSFRITIKLNLSSIIIISSVLFYLILIYYMFGSAKYGVGIFWDDIYRYPLMSNDYHNLGPTIRAPYVAWPSLIGFLSNVSGLSYYHTFVVLLFFSALVPLSIYCYYLGLTGQHTRNTLVIWFVTVIVFSAANLSLIPILTNYSFTQIMSNVRLLAHVTIEKYGPPNYVGALLYAKAAAMGLSIGLLSISLPLFKGETSELRSKLISLPLYVYQLYLGNPLFFIITFPLLLWRFKANLRIMVITVLGVVLLIDALYKFPFINKLFLYTNYAGVYTLLPLFFILFAPLVLLPRIVVNTPRFLFRVRTFMRLYRQVIYKVLCILMFLWLSYSLLVEIIGFDAYKYSDMWTKNLILPPTYLTIKTYGLVCAVFLFLGVLFQSKDKKLLMEVLLWLSGVFLSAGCLLILSNLLPGTVGLINRVMSYGLIPLGIILVDMLNSFYSQAKKMKKVAIITIALIVLFSISLMYTFFYCFAWIKLGSRSQLPEEETKILEYFSQLNKNKVVTVMVHDKELAYRLASLPNIRVIWLNRNFPFTGPSKYYIHILKGDEKEVRHVLSILSVDYVIYRHATFGKKLQNIAYLRYLQSLPRMEGERYVIYVNNVDNELRTNNSYCVPHIIPSPINNFLELIGIKDCLISDQRFSLAAE